MLAVKILFLNPPNDGPQTIVLTDNRSDDRHLLLKPQMAFGADRLEGELGRRFFDVMMAVTVDTDRVGEVDLLGKIPVMRSRLHLLGLLAMTVGTAGDMRAELGADEAELRLMGIIIDVAIA